MNFNIFTELHFDSYQNSLNIIINNLITYGEQLLPVLFFYVPASIWINKPKGSSYLLADKLNYSGFSNVAIGFFGEGYINLGL